MYVYLPQCLCKGQKTAFWSWFSSLPRLQGLNPGREASLLAESSRQPRFIDCCSLLPSISLGVSAICSHFLVFRVDLLDRWFETLFSPNRTTVQRYRPLWKHSSSCTSHILMLVRFSLFRSHSEFLLWFPPWSDDDSESYLFSRHLRVVAWSSCRSLLGFHSSRRVHSIISVKKEINVKLCGTC